MSVNENMSIAPEETGSEGISRRHLLFGAGVIAAGYTVGQLAGGTSVAFGYADALTPTEALGACEWPTTAGWNAAFGSFDAACQEAAIRSYERYKSGGG